MSQPQMSIEFTEVDTLSDAKNRIKEIREIKPAKPKISPFYAMVAKNIAAARRMTGLDQSEIGQAIYGRDAKNRICEYETGSQRPSIETIFKLAKALGCSADYLLGLTNDPTPKHLEQSELRAKERIALSAWRRGDFREAIKVIVDDE